MPAVSMVASWRKKIAMSPGLGFLPAPHILACFLILNGMTPWRRRSARSACSFAARLLPGTRLPLRSLPSHWKGTSLVMVAVCAMSLGPRCSQRRRLFDRDAVDFFEARQAVLDLVKTRGAQVPHALEPRLVADADCVAAFHD